LGSQERGGKCKSIATKGHACREKHRQKIDGDGVVEIWKKELPTLDGQWAAPKQKKKKESTRLPFALKHLSCNGGVAPLNHLYRRVRGGKECQDGSNRVGKNCLGPVKEKKV